MPDRKPDKVISVNGPTRIELESCIIEVDFSRRGRPVLRIWTDSEEIRIDRTTLTCHIEDCSFVRHDR